MEQRFKFRRVNEITGVFVLFVVVALIAAIVWTGRTQSWFRGYVTLGIVLPEEGAAGIRRGSEVYFLGTLVGTVSDVIVDEYGRMVARANIRRDFFRFVRADSSAVVKRVFGVVGDAFFEITRGQGAPLKEKDASIVCTELPPTAMESAIEDLRRETLVVLKKTTVSMDAWTTLSTTLIAGEARLDQLIGRMDSIAADLQEGKGAVGRLLTNPAAADQLETLLVKANRSMDDLQEGKGTVGRLLANPAVADQLEALLAKANRSLDEIQVTLENLQKASASLQQASDGLPAIANAIGKEAKDLPGLVSKTQQTVQESGKLVEGLQRHWLVRPYIEQPQPDTRIPPGEIAP
ncbi:MAG: hypothetical protein NTW86_00925 [Candidatus Sumerlaeota bacterium]|nr:hypothetical protein [Candidatus Sumerlaeota bacterium]